jgi:uncharacterized protein (TIGR00303 family)
MSSIKIALNESKGKEFIKSIEGKESLFILAIAYTETAEIDGITIAGADKDMIKYTPPADAEFLYSGICKCIDAIPATPDGKPTPALITRAALRLMDIPVYVIDSGSKVKPMIPHYTLAVRHGCNIAYGKALSIEDVNNAFYSSIELGSILGKSSSCLVIGESIPAGTTTALAVMLALGIDARFKVSSSMPDNPHNIKLKVAYDGMKSAGIDIGSLAKRPLDAISMLGDPMMPCVAGLSIGAIRYANTKVILAGGTQMAAILAIIKSCINSIIDDDRDNRILDNIAIATTSYVINDNSADIKGLVASIDDCVPLLYYDPLLDRSKKRGLRAYAEGFVKEGVGAGGACIATIAKSMHNINSMDILNAIEEEYENVIEKRIL